MHADFTNASGPRQSWLRGFLASNPYFTTEEFVRTYCSERESRHAALSALGYYARVGYVHRVRRALFMAPTITPDPFLLTAKLAEDAVVAYRSALAFHGVGDLEYSFPFATRRFPRSFCFNELIYQGIKPQLADDTLCTRAHDHLGHEVIVTTPARSLVDCLDRLDLGLGFVATFEAITAAPEFEIDFDEAAAYATALGKPVVAARVGAFLWAHPKWHSRTYPHQFHLARLGSRHTLRALPDRPTGGCKHLARFRLIVPEEFLCAMDRARAK